jgi:hypothetical protein
MATLARTLAKGDDVWFAMKVSTRAFETDKLLRGHDGLSFVVPQFAPADAESAHAILLAGYVTRPTGRFFLIHNSWGPGWGEGGYAWIHEATLRMNIDAAYVVAAHATAAPPPPNVGHPPVQCPPDQAPDGASGHCSLICGDSSPRFNGACPVATHCAAGFVNLSGQCVVAAPSESGVNPSTKIAHRCGPGGCLYTLPKGAPGCAFAWCSITCAAPRYKLSFGPAGHACSP